LKDKLLNEMRDQLEELEGNEVGKTINNLKQTQRECAKLERMIKQKNESLKVAS